MRSESVITMDRAGVVQDTRRLAGIECQPEISSFPRHYLCCVSYMLILIGDISSAKQMQIETTCARGGETV